MQKLKKFPIWKTDEEAEHFVDTADLSEYDFSDFEPVHFELVKKDKVLNMRLPETLEEAVKKLAEKRGMNYHRYVRSLLEEAVHKEATQKAVVPKAA